MRSYAGRYALPTYGRNRALNTSAPPWQRRTQKVAKLKHMLEVKAAELAGTDMVMVHDLLVLTNDFLSDKNRADEERSKGGGGGESLFQKMLTEEQRQRDKRVRGM